MSVCAFVFCKQKTAYGLRMSDWSSDVCSSDLAGALVPPRVELPDLVHHPSVVGIDAMGAVVRVTREMPLQDQTCVVQGRSLSVRVELGGRRFIKKTQQDKNRSLNT